MVPNSSSTCETLSGMTLIGDSLLEEVDQVARRAVPPNMDKQLGRRLVAELWHRFGDQIALALDSEDVAL